MHGVELDPASPRIQRGGPAGGPLWADAMKPIIKRKWAWTSPRWMKTPNFTFYPFIFMKPGWASADLRHELIHFWQVRIHGRWNFSLSYLWQRIRKPYREISWEKQAYEKQQDSKFLPRDLEELVRADGP